MSEFCCPVCSVVSNTRLSEESFVRLVPQHAGVGLSFYFEIPNGGTMETMVTAGRPGGGVSGASGSA